MDLTTIVEPLIERKKEILAKLKEYDALKEDLEKIDQMLALAGAKTKGGKGNSKPRTPEQRAKMSEGQKAWRAKAKAEKAAKEAEEAAMEKTKSASKRAAAGG